VTDAAEAALSDCIAQLRNVVRRSVHESRNALNGLVVNLEVVRSRLARSGDEADVLAFAEQAAAQGEESVRLTEAVGALLALIVGSVDGEGRLRCSSASTAPAEIRFGLEPGVAERVLPGLRTLGKSVGFTAETSGAEAVILSFPDISTPESKEH
jgi:hypothetical protein